MDEKLIQDLDGHIENVKDLKAWLDTVYYNEEFVNFMTKPVLAILASACVHIIDNLKTLKKKHIAA